MDKPLLCLILVLSGLLGETSAADYTVRIYDGGAEGLGLATADFNEDGMIDLAASFDHPPRINIFLGNPSFFWPGNGNLQTTLPFGPWRDFAVAVRPQWIAAGDFNGDGHQDIVAAGSQDVILLFGNGKGEFVSSSERLDATITALAAGEFGVPDGRTDYCVALSADYSSLRCFTSRGPKEIPADQAIQAYVSQYGKTIRLRLNRDAFPDTVTLSETGVLEARLTSPNAVFTVRNTNDNGAGSLRQAILDANSQPGADLVEFDIPGSAPFRISPNTELPAITEALTIDATTQPGYAGSPIVELNGSALEMDGTGLVIQGGNSVVRGMVINGFWRPPNLTEDGIRIETNGGNIIEGNFVGINVRGDAVIYNGRSGIHISSSSNNQIGGTLALARNVIAGSIWNHVHVSGAESSNNTIAGNYVGTTKDGAAGLFGGTSGIHVEGNGNIIGGTAPHSGNLISGNSCGVRLFPGSANLIQGNRIGTDATGTQEIGNGTGIRLESGSNNVIGGISIAARNIISGNSGSGVGLFSSSGNTIQGNFIGTQVDGISPLGNQNNGISIGHFSNNSNRIGGDGEGEANVIAFSGHYGVHVDGGVQNAILSNSIHSNGSSGIVLGDFAVNDYLDRDTGANMLQNHPEILVSRGSDVNPRIEGRLHSTPTTAFLLQFFSNPFQRRDGKVLLGSMSVTTNEQGNVTFNYSYPLIPGTWISATATDPDNNTSQFAEPAFVTDKIYFVSAGGLSEICGNGDPYVNPGEQWSIVVTLRNDGAQTASAVTADLVAVGATVENNPGIFGDIPPGSTAQYVYTFVVNPNQNYYVSFQIPEIFSLEGKYLDWNGFWLDVLGWGEIEDCWTCPAITLVPETLSNGITGSVYATAISATGGFEAGYELNVTQGQLPDGLTLNALTHKITGTPTEEGVFAFTITALDAFGCSGSREYEVEVFCNAITLTPGNLTAGTLGESYNAAVSAEGSVGSYTFTVADGMLPNGLTLGAHSGGIFGTPVIEGNFAFTISATDAFGCSGSQEYMIQVSCPVITLTPDSLPAGTLGESYSATVSAGGGVGSCTFTVADGVLPNGLILGANSGEISGTPVIEGTFAFTINATDASGCSGSREYIVQVSCPAITLTPDSLPAGILGGSYSAIVSAGGGVGSYTFALANGALPNGLTLGANSGEISGTPVSEGNFIFTITATDADGCTGSRSYNIEVSCGILTLLPESLPDAQINVSYLQQLTPSGGTAPYTIELSAGELPPGLSLTPGGEILGSPGVAGSYAFAVQVTDVNQCEVTKEYSMNIGCLFCDDFEDGMIDSRWVYTRGSWTENGESLVGSPGKGQSIAAATPVFPGCSNCYIEATISTKPSGIAWLIGWYEESKNGIELLMRESRDRWTLKERLNGSVVAKASTNLVIDPDVFYRARIAFDGSRFEVFINDMSILSVTAVSQHSGSVAFKVKNAPGSFGEIIIN